MRRRLITLTAAVSLLLCVASVVMWIRSYQKWDAFGCRDERVLEQSSFFAMSSGAGCLWAFHEGYDARLRQRRPPAYLWSGYSDADAPNFLMFDPGGEPEPRHRLLAWDHSGPWRSGFVIVACPYWILVLASAILPAAVVQHHRRKNRLRRGLCSTCSYDLTANTSGTCPECGTPVPKAPEPKSPQPA